MTFCRAFCTDDVDGIAIDSYCIRDVAYSNLRPLAYAMWQWRRRLRLRPRQTELQRSAVDEYQAMVRALSMDSTMQMNIAKETESRSSWTTLTMNHSRCFAIDMLRQLFDDEIGVDNRRR